MQNKNITSLTPEQVKTVRDFWKNDPSFIGYPDAERDTTQDEWFNNLLVQPKWFSKAIEKTATVVVARKGAGKSAARLTSMNNRESETSTLIIETSADELVSLHAERLQKSSERGYGSVSDWLYIYADLICRKLAQDMSGKLLINDDEIGVRTWAKFEGITDRDFGERLVDALKSIIPWAEKVSKENAGQEKISLERIARVAQATKFCLYVDDFDNLQEKGGITSVRLIRDAVEAADRLTHHNKNSEVHLFMRQDLWLNITPGWHYLDKVSGVVELNWDISELKMWTKQRLSFAVGRALNKKIEFIQIPFDEMWRIFFVDEVTLKDKSKSESFSYFVRRSMYTPRSIQSLIKQSLRIAEQFPVTNYDIQEAELPYSVDQLEFLKTEFGGLCKGLDICLQSFTGHSLEWLASDLYKHLKGLIGNGQVKLYDGVSSLNSKDEIALARFLYRIGFLEVRYPLQDRYEVRDVMRYPEHWRSIRTDDAVKWAVRSAFFHALKEHNKY